MVKGSGGRVRIMDLLLAARCIAWEGSVYHTQFDAISMAEPGAGRGCSALSISLICSTVAEFNARLVAQDRASHVDSPDSSLEVADRRLKTCGVLRDEGFL